MKNLASLFLLFFLFVNSGLSAATSTRGNLPLLSWAPYEYLRKGYRNAPWIRDPFYPEDNGLHLSGVISNEMAFINGKWFRRGEKVEGYEVKAITAQGVTLKRQGELIILKIAQ